MCQINISVQAKRAAMHVIILLSTLDIFFHQITTFLKVRVAFFWASDPLIDRYY